MTHTFLLEPGQWHLKGVWCESNLQPISIEGIVSILWSQPNWFSWNKQLKISNSEELNLKSRYLSESELSLTYRGYLGFRQSQYTFVLKHNLLGDLEGNGWITPSAIIQRYWVLNDRKRRQGFETLSQETENTYHFCSCLTQGHQMINTIEARLNRTSS